jgi:uncharacterized protein DUF5916/cellulose/xylan binding protein with CBM9 domain
MLRRIVFTVCAAGALGRADAQSSGPSGPAVVPEGADAVARAVRAARAPVLDGRGDDEVWQSAPVTRGFRQFYPQEDGAPSVETEFRAAYDDRNLYLLVRALDPHPDSIRHAITRRDVPSASDYIGITIDGFDDHRTGYEFVVNPDGVKRDCAVYADTLYDWSWDGVWDAAARVDSRGWTAEFSIPFSQIRYSDVRDHTFGIAVWRNSNRFQESSIWPLWRISRGGLMSQLGRLVGVDDIEAPRSFALAPYIVASNASTTARAPDGRFGRAQRQSGGADLRFVPSSNYTIDATINPDFGQVEADPSVLNLTAAETFYPEQRPFFLQGRRLYELDLGCNPFACANEGLFYSRRVGRAPQLAASYPSDDAPLATPIAGAAKLTGRSSSGLTVAAFDAVTPRVGGDRGTTLEPPTNYAFGRAVQELDGGATTIGLTTTAVDRSLDTSSAPLLRSAALTGAVDLRQRLGRSPFVFSGSLAASDVRGSRAAISATQQSSVHYFQRPGSSEDLDTTRTGLAGNSEELSIGNYSGAVQFASAWQRHSAGLEVNDIGFMQRADEERFANGLSIGVRTPHWVYRLLTVNVDAENVWNTSGLVLDRGLSSEAFAILANNWNVDLTGRVMHVGATYCDQCARGGPALRQDPLLAAGVVINGDSRRMFVPAVGVSSSLGDGGRSSANEIDPAITLNLSPRLQGTIGGSLAVNHADAQWFGNFTDTAGTVHYAFAHLDQRTLSFSARASYAQSPTMTLELYAAPFVSVGTYGDMRQLSAVPDAADYATRFAAYAPPSSALAGFDVRQFRSSAVARWEYRPGSTLFVVWTHGRDGTDPTSGGRPWDAEYRSLFALHPENTFLVKVAYWLAR